MAHAVEEQYTRMKLAQLCRSRYTNSIDHYKNIINHILGEDFDINCVFTIDYGDLSERTTALHRAIERIELFEILLNRNADFTIRDGKGLTVLHLITQKYLYGALHHLRSWGLQFFNAVLSAHVRLDKSVNPKFENGLSHFHAACVANHVEAAKLFLQNGTSVNEAIDMKSSESAGYTGLHFAVKFYSFEVAQLLLSYRANVHAMSAEGLTPIHLLLKQRMKLFEKLHRLFKPYDYSEEKVMKAIQGNEKVIKLIILENHLSLITGLSHFHVACSLQETSIAESIVKYVNDINYSVPTKSPVFQKFTALHFAAYCNIDTLKFLVTKGANLQIEDENRNTPLDLCIQRYDIKDIVSVLLLHPTWKNIVFSNEKTKLLDVVPLMRNVSSLRAFLQLNMEDVNMFIPFDSSLWPGYNLLHLAVIFSIEDLDVIGNEATETAIVREILKYKVNINAQDIRGQTPIHLAFRKQKESHTEFLLKQLIKYDEKVNLSDEDNLCYLHIACAADCKKVVFELLKHSDLDIPYQGKSLTIAQSLYSVHPGWTPLHISVSLQGASIVRMLINQGANVNVVDMEGLTPVHWLLDYNKDRDHGSQGKIINVLFASSNLQHCIASDFGLNYLHVACFANNLEAVKKLLELKVPPFIKIVYNELTNRSQNKNQKRPSSFLAKYVEYTPLSFAITCENSKEIINLLLHHANETLFTSFEEKLILSERFYGAKNNMICMMKANVQIQKQMEENYGLTQLHVACYLIEIESIEKLLKQGANVNAQVMLDSSFYPGFTPLHMCLTGYKQQTIKYDVEKKLVLAVDLLMNHGADVTLVNAQGKSLIFALCNEYKTAYLVDYELKIIAKCFRHQRDFSVNPSNKKISHFHVACITHDLEIIKMLLQHGQIDINEPIDNFSSSYFAGCTPLHLAIQISARKPSHRLAVIDLLLNHDADVHAKDINGNTPLHVAAGIYEKNPRVEILGKLVAHGACMNMENLEGVTPFEKLVPRISCRDIQFLKNRGCQLAVFNRFSAEGYLGKFLSSIAQRENEQERNLVLKEFIELSKTAGMNDPNRTAIHNAVAVSFRGESHFSTQHYHQLLNHLLSKNCGIDNQDKFGKTALHYAAQFGNHTGVAALLQLGANVNIIDKSGKLAGSYSLEQCTAPYHGIKMSNCNSYKTTCVLVKHAKKLRYLSLEVNEFYIGVDSENLEKLHSRKCMYTIDKSLIDYEVEKTENIDFGFRSLNLHNLLTETGLVSLYPHLNTTNRSTIKNVLNNFIPQMKFQEIEGVLKLQFNKAVLRLGLIEEAINSLRAHLGFSFPGLCEEIVMYLTNCDLKTLIASTAQSNE